MVASRARSMMSPAAMMLGCLVPLGLLVVPTFFQPVQALDIAYCTDINTASRPGNYSIYQSNGLCKGFCVQSYAFAIVQDHYCWCSNYAPASTDSSSSCNKQCPGYPDDLCGGDKLYGYIKLDQPPRGTKSSSGTGVTAEPAKFDIGTTGLGDCFWLIYSHEPNNNRTPRRRPGPNLDAHPPITSVETVTGQVRVVTITPTAPPDTTPHKSSGLSKGGAAGLGIGLAAAAVLIGILIFFLLRRRRRRAAEASEATPTSPTNGYTPQRTMSENSRYMLGTDGRRVVEGWDGDADTPVSAGSRRSRLMPVDPRLDPFAPVYQRGDGRRSGESVGSIQDNHDYSRRVHQTGPILRATNPDT